MGKRNYNRETLKRWNVLALLLLSAGAFSACSHDIDLTKPSSQENVGVQMAKMNLWREARFRFQRAIELNPKDAMAHSNLAVAFEANGDFDAAAKEYREALRLDRSNTYIQKNYSRFTEFMSRSKKRSKSATVSAGEMPGKSATEAPAATPASAPAAGETPPSGTAPAGSPPPANPPSSSPAGTGPAAQPATTAPPAQPATPPPAAQPSNSPGGAA